MAEGRVLVLGRVGAAALADILPETPETVMTIHLLRRGLTRVVVTGDPAQPGAVVAQAHALPEEPTAHGKDPAAIWAALRRLDGWE